MDSASRKLTLGHGCLMATYWTISEPCGLRGPGWCDQVIKAIPILQNVLTVDTSISKI
jgi:hypothetical protein